MKTDTVHQAYEGERDRPGRSVACPAQPPHQSSIFNLQPSPSPVDAALVPKCDVSRAPMPDVPLVNHPVIHSSNHPSSAKPRNGKIARLPKPVRDTVNRMLFNHVPQEHIAAALEEIGIHVTQRNISNWKTRGGYREWRLAQEYGIQLHVHQDNLLDLLRRHDACELPELGLQAAATQLSQFFLTPEASQLLASDPKEYERRVSMLSRISAQLKPLQKYRDDCARNVSYKHDPERVRRDTTGELEKLRHDWSSNPGNSAKDEPILHRNALPDPGELFHLLPPDPKPFFPTFEEWKEARSRQDAQAAAKPQPTDGAAPPSSSGATPDTSHDNQGGSLKSEAESRLVEPITDNFRT